MELYERIRRDHAERGWSIRRLAKEHRVHRREVRQALLNAQPPPSAPLNRSRPVLGPLRPVIDAILEQDRKAPRKQRHTVQPVARPPYDARRQSRRLPCGHYLFQPRPAEVHAPLGANDCRPQASLDYGHGQSAFAGASGQTPVRTEQRADSSNL